MKYIYRFADKKKISDEKTQMAMVTVYNIAGKEIGTYSWGYLSKINREEQINNMVREIIRDYEQSRAFNRQMGK